MGKPKEPTLPEAAVRIVDGKRINLKQFRERKAAERVRPKPPIEDTRVADAWDRQEARVAVAKRNTAERKRMRSLAEGGADGAQEFKAPVRLSLERVEKRKIRCRPGTFEWRYGRKTADGTLYHAGCHYAVLYERAGTAAASSPDMGSQGGGDWKGLPDGRVAALDALKPVNAKLGDEQRLRLVAYCVEGLSVSEIAQWAGEPVRDVAAVIHSDMKALAKALHFL